MLIFLQIPQRSHRSTVFPYTTLFRSDQRGHVPPLGPARHLRQRLLGRSDAQGRPARPRTRRRERRRDRKSTCLNSSHRCISYVVFCLTIKNVTVTGLLYVNLVFAALL